MSSNAATSSTTHEHYYVPAQSRLPVWMAFGMFLTVFGAGKMMNDMSSGAESSSSHWWFFAGALVFAVVLYNWFSKVIRENHAGLNSVQLKKSYVWGMGWFIFSEVMFLPPFSARCSIFVSSSAPGLVARVTKVSPTIFTPVLNSAGQC